MFSIFSLFPKTTARKPVLLWPRVVAVLMSLANGEMAVSRAAAPDLTQLGIEELMNVQVVSASKQAQRLADAASAVFVITQDDIRRRDVYKRQILL